MASRFWVGGTGTWNNATTTHWSATTGGAGGASVPGSIDTANFDANSGGGTVTPNYNMSLANLNIGAFTGTLDFSANNPSPTISGSFNISGTGVRTLNLGSGTYTISTSFVAGTTTNLTFSAGSSTLLLNGANVSIGGALTYNNITVTGGGTFAIGNSPTCNNFTYTGVGAGDSISRQGASMTVTGTLTITGKSSVNKTSVMSNTAGTIRTFTFTNASLSNVTWTDIALTQSGVGGTWTLLEDLNLTSATGFPQLAIQNGTFTTNNFAITAGVFTSTGTNTRTINFGSSLITIFGNGTVWNVNTTGVTLNAGTSTIKMTDVSNVALVFAGASGGSGTATYNNIWFSRGASTGTITINNTLTFNNFKDDGTRAHSVLFAAGTTTTITTLTVSGTAGNLITLKSTVNGSAWNIVSQSNTISVDYVSLQDSHVSGRAIFLADINSIDVSNNTGWIFSNEIVTSQNAVIDGSNVSSMIASVSTPLVAPIRIYANPTTHGIWLEDNTTGTNYGLTDVKHDDNGKECLSAVSNSDGTTVVPLYANGGHQLLVSSS